MSNFITDFINSIRKKIVWVGFSFVDWAEDLDTAEKLAKFIETQIKDKEDDYKFFTSNDEERKVLLAKIVEDALEEGRKEAEEELQKEVVFSTSEYEHLFEEAMQKAKEDLVEFEEKFVEAEAKEFIEVLKLVLQEVKDGKHGDDLVSAMKRVEELTSYEAF